MVEQYREREDKFDVGPDWALPDLTEFLPAGGETDQRTVSISNRYFDTPSLDLLARGVTLRLRRGDTDTGWQLKVPDGPARTELRVPSNGSRSVPAELRDVIFGLSGGAALRAVATVETTRSLTRILDAAGDTLAEIDDDTVTATPTAPGTQATRWREIEVELGAADEQFLTDVAQRLTTAGAAPSRSASKLARALGASTSSARRRRQPRTLAELVGDYLQQQYVALLDGDLALRRGQDVIHATRVATRRYRSVLRVFGDLFDPDRAVAMDRELAWYAGLLGVVRDRQVLRRHLDESVSALPPEVVLGPVAASIDSHLHGEELAGRQALKRQLRSKRYLALLADLKDWNQEPPVTDAAGLPVDAVRDYVNQANRKLRRRLDQALAADASDEQMHRARKAGKRARYTAELAQPVMGKRARRIVKRAKSVQDVLGEHQDSIIAGELLQWMGATAGSRPGENGFTFGLLYAAERQRWQTTGQQARKLHWP